MQDMLVNGSALFDEVPLMMPRWGYVASAFVLFLIGFIGFFLNLMVVLLMFKDRQLWTPLNMILFNLVCSDLCVSVLGNPLTLISALFHHWVFGKTMCMLYGFFMALLGITSITTLTVLSFERYMMVTRPLSSQHLSSKGAGFAILFIWTYSLLLTTPPLFGWGNYVNEAANISCSVNWHEQSTNTMTYILFLFAMGQVVPFAVIIFSYVNIVRTIRRNAHRMRRVGRAETKVTAMVFVMILAFSFAWAPYSVFALIEQFVSNGIISPGLGVIPALVAKSSICYDPLIYIGMNTQFRQSIRKIFGKTGKGGISQSERPCDTLMSMAHRISRTNETVAVAVTPQPRLNTVDSDMVPVVIKKHVVIYNTKAKLNLDAETVSQTSITNEIRKVKDTTIIHKSKTESLKHMRKTLREGRSFRKRNEQQEVFGGSCCHLSSESSNELSITDSNKIILMKKNLSKRTGTIISDFENVFNNEGYSKSQDVLDELYPK